MKTDFNGLQISHPGARQLTDKEIATVLKNEFNFPKLLNNKTIANRIKLMGYTGFAIEAQGARLIVNTKFK